MKKAIFIVIILSVVLLVLFGLMNTKGTLLNIEESNEQASIKAGETSKASDISPESILKSGMAGDKQEAPFDTMTDSMGLEEYDSELPGRHFSELWHEALLYLKKDKQILDLIEKADIRELVSMRYNLDTEDQRGMALTDLWETVRLINSEYYLTNLPKEQYLPFVDAVLDAILEKDPANYSAQLLKCRIAVETDGIKEAVEKYKNVCSSIEQLKDKDIYICELTNVTCAMLSINELDPEGKKVIKESLYKAGLPKDCPLADYMERGEGKPWSTVMNRFRIKDPFDFDRTQHMAEQFTNTSDPIYVTGCKIAALVQEKDVRALLESTHNNSAMSQEQKEITFILADFLAGRYSSALPNFERFIENQNLLQSVGEETELLYGYYALACYESGDYRTAQKALTVAYDHMYGDQPAKQRVYEELFSDIENRLSIK